MDELVKHIRNIVKEEDDKIARQGGRWKNELATQLDFFTMGMKGVVPKEWEKYEAQLDPDYKEYLRLKGKFGKYE